MLHSSQKLQTVFSDSDSDDSIIPLKIHNEENSALKNEIKILKTGMHSLNCKLKNLKTKFEEVYQLNIELQKKLLESPKTAFGESSGDSRVLSENTPTIPPLSPTAPPRNSALSDVVHESLPEPTIQAMENMDEVSLEICSFQYSYLVAAILLAKAFFFLEGNGGGGRDIKCYH